MTDTPTPIPRRCAIDFRSHRDEIAARLLAGLNWGEIDPGHYVGTIKDVVGMTDALIARLDATEQPK